MTFNSVNANEKEMSKPAGRTKEYLSFRRNILDTKTLQIYKVANDYFIFY